MSLQHIDSVALHSVFETQLGHRGWESVQKRACFFKTVMINTLVY